jgi:hypothetical protein
MVLPFAPGVMRNLFSGTPWRFLIIVPLSHIPISQKRPLLFLGERYFQKNLRFPCIL